MIQDFETNLTEQQEYLYELFEGKEVQQCENSLSKEGQSQVSHNVFEMLTRMR